MGWVPVDGTIGKTLGLGLMPAELLSFFRPAVSVRGDWSSQEIADAVLRPRNLRHFVPEEGRAITVAWVELN